MQGIPPADVEKYNAALERKANDFRHLGRKGIANFIENAVDLARQMASQDYIYVSPTLGARTLQ